MTKHKYHRTNKLRITDLTKDEMIEYKAGFIKSGFIVNSIKLNNKWILNVSKKIYY